MDVIKIVLEVVIFMSLIGTIATLVAGANANVTGTARVLILLTTLFIVIGFIVYIMRVSGLKKGR